MSATTTTPTLSTSIVLDSIELILENAERVIVELERYDDQLVTRTKIVRSEGNDAELERYRGMQHRTATKLAQARELLQFSADAYNDFASGRVSALQTVENMMLAGEMLRLIDPAASKEQGA